MARNHLRTFVSLVSAVGLVASCGRAALLPTAPGAGSQGAPYAGATGTVTLAIEIPPPKPELARLSIRRVRLQDIDSIDVRASRPGSRQEVLAAPNPVAVTFTGSTPNSASATLSLPVGNNYIVTVTALNRSGKAIPGGVLKGAVNVAANATTTATISSATTPAARAIELLAAANPTLAGQISASQIQALVNQITGNAPYTTKPSRIDPQAIADAIAGSGTVPAAPTAAMTLGTGTITVHVVNAQNNQPVNGASVVVGDPLSAIGTTNSSGDATITGVAPGRWPVTAGGNLVPVAIGEAYVIPGQTRAADPQPTVYQPQQVPTSSTSQVLGRDGGTISISGVLDLNVPAGALTGDRRVRVTTYGNADPSRFYAWRIDPQALQFNVPATVTFHYTDQQLATWGVADPTRPGQIVMSQYQGVPTGSTPILPREVALPTTVNTTARTVTAQLSETGVAANPGVLTVQGTGHVTVTPSASIVSSGGNTNFTLTYDGDPDPDLSLLARLNGPGVADTVALPGTDPAGMTVKRAEDLDVGAEVKLTFMPLPPTPSPSPTPTAPPSGTPPTPAPPNEGPPTDIPVPIGHLLTFLRKTPLCHITVINRDPGHRWEARCGHASAGSWRVFPGYPAR